MLRVAAPLGDFPVTDTLGLAVGFAVTQFAGSVEIFVHQVIQAAAGEVGGFFGGEGLQVSREKNGWGLDWDFCRA